MFLKDHRGIHLTDIDYTEMLLEAHPLLVIENATNYRLQHVGWHVEPSYVIYTHILNILTICISNATQEREQISSWSNLRCLT
jgi:hypothetical protein